MTKVNTILGEEKMGFTVRLRFQGIGTIFNYYVKALETQFKKLRDEYRLAPSLVSNAIKKFSLECFEREESVLNLEDAIEFFSEKFPRQPWLLDDLIQESVFIRNCRENYKTEKKEEVIYFAYERFGDFFTANELIKNFQSKNEVLNAFSKEERLGKMVQQSNYRGVIEALAILLPEIYDLELFEVYAWMYTKLEDDDYGKRNTFKWHNHFLLDSLKWRSINSINEKKLISWFKGDFFKIDDGSYFNMLVELSTIKNHPFNSNRMHRILSNLEMPKRDSFWQRFTLWYSEYNDDNVATPLRRLIDWAWSPSISNKVDTDTAILASQTLSWVLVSTNRKLRDEVTKAIVNLLEQQPEALIELLTRFKDVNDMYVQERLYAIAYGCILRTRDVSSVELIGNYVYENIFKSSNPPEHILLRDYARNTVEYMLYRGKGAEINTEKIRPPYKSSLPIYPSKEEISLYYIPYENSEYDEKFTRTYNRISFSVMSWDFGRKTVKPVLDKFCPVSFTTEKEYKKFIEELPNEQREHIFSVVKMIASKEILQKKNTRYGIEKLGGQKNYDSLLKKHKDAIDEGTIILKSLSKNQSDYIIDKILPYLDNVQRLESRDFRRKSFNRAPIKRWIVKRAHELGYNVKLHGDYDRSYGVKRPDIEQIAQKYQWIAFHEILSILSDNHKIKDWYSDEKFGYYQGAWEFYARDVDPIYTIKNAEERPKDDMMILEKEHKWWHDHEYSFWSQENYQWVRNMDDLPKVKYIIRKKDKQENEWLFLNKFVTWEMPKSIGDDKYSMYRKEVWYKIQGYLVKKDDKQSIINFLQDKNFWGNWMPEVSDESNQLFNREKYWSPAYNSYESKNAWVEIYYNHKSTGLFVVPSTQDAKAHISEDKSGAEHSYNIPCEQIFNKLGLIYAPNDGDFINSKGELVVQNIPHSGGLMINKKILMDYLEENDLEIIWTLLGEKMAFLSHGEQNYFGAPCGVFYLENGEVKGQLNYYDRD